MKPSEIDFARCRKRARELLQISFPCIQLSEPMLPRSIRAHFFPSEALAYKFICDSSLCKKAVGYLLLQSLLKYFLTTYPANELLVLQNAIQPLAFNRGKVEDLIMLIPLVKYSRWVLELYPQHLFLRIQQHSSSDRSMVEFGKQQIFLLHQHLIILPQQITIYASLLVH